MKLRQTGTCTLRFFVLVTICRQFSHFIPDKLGINVNPMSKMGKIPSWAHPCRIKKSHLWGWNLIREGLCKPPPWINVRFLYPSLVLKDSYIPLTFFSGERPMAERPPCLQKFRIILAHDRRNWLMIGEKYISFALGADLAPSILPRLRFAPFDT